MDTLDREKMEYSVVIPDHRFFEDEVECRSGCPVHTDARGYLIAVSKGDFRKGYVIARETNPFASICGKVCGAPCETACRRSEVDETLSIRNIKGYLTAKHGPESGDLLTPLTYSIARGTTEPISNGKKVALIGGGCAGYTCAHDLARLGYACTIFEKYDRSGGMLIQGVPINRLSRKVVQAEIDSILQFKDITVKHNCCVGEDISFKEILSGFDAVFIGVGLAVGKKIPLENYDHPDVHSGLQFLLEFNLQKKWDLEAKRAIVIGGGDVAFDVARSSLRCQSPEVNLCCLEREHLGEMPGSADEREGGRKEGVIINDGWGPDKIIIENQKIKGLQIKKVKRVFNDQGAFAPEFLSETKIIAGEMIFFAVGQTSDLSFLKDCDIAINKMGFIEYDPLTMVSSNKKVFVGGDVAYGPKLFIDAIASGSKAALGIDAFLSGKPLMTPQRTLTFKEIENFQRSAHYLKLEKQERPELDVDPAKEPEKNATLEYDDQMADVQARRCLECHIHPTFEGNICILCGGCCDVCPSYCLSMFSIDRIKGNEQVDSLLHQEFGDLVRKRDQNSVMLFDPLKCIRCGMCAQKCPTGACMMSENTFNDDYREVKE